MSQKITKEQLEAFDASFAAQRANRVAMNAVTNNGLLASAIQRGAVENDVHEYSICLKQGDICNQKQSGRCWMFAALNTLRYQVMRKCSLKTFELSQAYLFFWDKLENPTTSSKAFSKRWRSPPAAVWCPTCSPRPWAMAASGICCAA